jgi:hypothetical protein
MAADIAASREEISCLSSGPLADAEPCLMEAMVQSVSKFEGKAESNMHSPYPWKILVPAERAKLRSKCKDTSRKMRDSCKLESAPVVQAKTCHDTTQRVGTEGHNFEVENSFTEEPRTECPQPDRISEKSLPSISNSEYHVLAVDDNQVEQIVIERLLKNSSYKGTVLIFLLLHPDPGAQLINHCHGFQIPLSRLTNRQGSFWRAVTTVNSAFRALEYLGLSESCPSSVNANVSIGPWPRNTQLLFLDCTVRC